MKIDCSEDNMSAERLKESIFGEYLKQKKIKYQVPAISLAVWHKGQLHQAACGILNLEAGVEATIDSVFQIGSITKVMTTCLVMQLVDEGRVDLDMPVKYYLRDFIIADPEASATITVRQLLNHTSGMAGDFFPDDQGHQGNLDCSLCRSLQFIALGDTHLGLSTLIPIAPLLSLVGWLRW